MIVMVTAWSEPAPILEARLVMTRPTTMYAKYAQENGMWRDVAQNPLMHNWNHIYVRYCDGAYYSGDRLEPRTIDGKEVFFRGRYITEAIFTDLAPKLATATDVVLSGCSAGAIASMHTWIL